jgi:hypothetical protein
LKLFPEVSPPFITTIRHAIFSELKHLETHSIAFIAYPGISDIPSICKMQAVEVPRFNLENGPEEVAAMLLYLQENGYAVCASVASPLEIEAAKESFWTYTHKVSAVLRTDITTWDDKDWLASPIDGICSSNGFNHSEFAWNTRCLPKVKAAFGAIWDSVKLIVSFDAGNVFRP